MSSFSGLGQKWNRKSGGRVWRWRRPQSCRSSTTSSFSARRTLCLLSNLDTASTGEFKLLSIVKDQSIICLMFSWILWKCRYIPWRNVCNSRVSKHQTKQKVKRRRGRVSQQQLDALIAEVKRDQEEQVIPSPIYGEGNDLDFILNKFKKALFSLIVPTTSTTRAPFITSLPRSQALRRTEKTVESEDENEDSRRRYEFRFGPQRTVFLDVNNRIWFSGPTFLS